MSCERRRLLWEGKLEDVKNMRRSLGFCFLKCIHPLDRLSSLIRQIPSFSVSHLLARVSRSSVPSVSRVKVGGDQGDPGEGSSDPKLSTREHGSEG